MYSSQQLRALLSVLFITLILGVFSISFELKKNKEFQIQQTILNKQHNFSFGDFNITTSGAFVYDSTDNIAIFEKNADIPRPIASIVKSLTAVTALRILGNDKIITINSNAISTEGDNGFTDGESFKIKDLIKFMLVASSNDTAVALAEAVGENFLEQETLLAKRIGLEKMSEYGVKSPNGLDDESDGIKPTVVATPREVATLFDFAIRSFPDVFSTTSKSSINIKSSNGISHTAQNTNTELDKFNGLIASKTGTTESGGANLVIAYSASNNHVIIVVVLGSTAEDRFSDSLELVRRTNIYMSL